MENEKILNRAIKQMDQVMPVIRPDSRSSKRGSNDRTTPDGHSPKRRNPRVSKASKKSTSQQSVSGPTASLKRTASAEDLEFGHIHHFDSSEDERVPVSRKSTRVHSTRRPSNVL